MVFGFFKKSLQINKDMWNAAGYWTDVVAAYGGLTDINIDAFAKHHGASKELDAFCNNCKDRGMTPSECAREIAEHGFAPSRTGKGPRLGQMLSMFPQNR